MKKHTATFMDIYVIIAFSLVYFLLVSITVNSFLSTRTDLSILFATFTLAFTVILIWLIIPLIFSTCIFSENGIVLRSIPKRTYNYNSFRDVGIGFYVHGFVTGHGPVIKYIYFSEEKLSRIQQVNLNSLRNSDKFLKINYSDDIYNYLINNMPSVQAELLAESMETNKKYLGLKFK